MLYNRIFVAHFFCHQKNNIGDKGVEDLADALRDNLTLTSLILTDNVVSLQLLSACNLHSLFKYRHANADWQRRLQSNGGYLANQQIVASLESWLQLDLRNWSACPSC